ncbi:hypothetical protein [Paralysiella testudinis]|uniref:Uncharacterized protein n=1 Tax=Paralysiella testudinis TaxID=2809020 RepID=A0A892ZG08_9NEIS|nr:hypothetical protein [Paralysiella testudinis]QRQ81490.1 hypothetical protein JQU52_12400 [Paralysiella testudinis]
MAVLVNKNLAAGSGLGGGIFFSACGAGFDGVIKGSTFGGLKNMLSATVLHIRFPFYSSYTNSKNNLTALARLSSKRTIL